MLVNITIDIVNNMIPVKLSVSTSEIMLFYIILLTNDNVFMNYKMNTEKQCYPTASNSKQTKANGCTHTENASKEFSLILMPNHLLFSH